MLKTFVVEIKIITIFSWGLDERTKILTVLTKCVILLKYD